MLTKDGNYVDGSWILSVFIDTLGLERKIRVVNDWSISKVINKTIEGLKAPQLLLYNPKDGDSAEKSLVPFSEYTFWWPDKAKWILHQGSSLSQYGIQADTWLRFTPSYGPVKIQLPDLQERIFPRVNFTDPIFRVVINLCKNLGIRHPEELSLMRPSTNFDLKRSRIDESNNFDSAVRKKKKCRRSQTIDQSLTTGLRNPRPRSYYGSDLSLNNAHCTEEPTEKPIPKFGPPKLRNDNGMISGSTYLNVVSSKGSSDQVIYQETSYSLDQSLISSPNKSTLDTLNRSEYPNLRPIDLIQKCHLFTNWLDSSKSLMEQGYENFQSIEASLIKKENSERLYAKPRQPLLQMRFKYGIYYDLNPKYDHIRINQLYNQAKWSILLDQIDCTENEACLLAAIKLHIDLKSKIESKMHTDNATSIYNLTSLSQIGQQRPLSEITNQDDRTENLYSSLKMESSRPTSHLSPMNFKWKPQELNDPETLRFMESEIDKMLDELGQECEVENCDLGTLRLLNRVRSASGNRALANDTSISSVRRGELSEYEDTPGSPFEKLSDLSSYVKMVKQRKHHARISKRVYVVMRDSIILVYKDLETCKRNYAPIESIDLRGCYVEFDVDFNESYSLKIYVPLVKSNLDKIQVYQEFDSESDAVRKLKSRGSFLSLTSLAGFINGGLNNAASFIAGLLEKIVIQLNDENQFIEWAAMCNLCGQLGPRTSLDHKILCRENYDSEKANVKRYLGAFESLRSSGRFLDLSVNRSSDTSSMLKNLMDYLPLKISLQMNPSHNTTVSSPHSHRKPPASPASVLKSQTLDRTGRIPSSSSRTNYENYFGKEELPTKILHIFDQISSKDATSLGFKLRYIATWRNLQNHGLAYFLALFNTSAPLSIVTDDNGENKLQSNLVNKFNNFATKFIPFQSSSSSSFLTLTMSRKEEIFAVNQKRIFRIDPQTGSIKASWKYSNIQGWHVNFELNELILYLAPIFDDKKTSGKVVIRPTQVPVNVLAEYLGGYALLSMRAPFKRQELDEKKFYQLTSAGNRISLAI